MSTDNLSSACQDDTATNLVASSAKLLLDILSHFETYHDMTSSNCQDCKKLKLDERIAKSVALLENDDGKKVYKCLVECCDKKFNKLTPQSNFPQACESFVWNEHVTLSIISLNKSESKSQAQQKPKIVLASEIFKKKWQETDVNFMILFINI